MKKFFSKIGQQLKKDKWYVLSSVVLFGVSTVIFSLNSSDPELLAKKSFLAELKVEESIAPDLSSFSRRVNVVENVFTELNYNPRLTSENMNVIGGNLANLMISENAYKKAFNSLGYSVSSEDVSSFKKEISYKESKDLSSSEESVQLELLRNQTIIFKMTEKLKEEADKKVTDDQVAEYYEKNKEDFLIDKNVFFYSESFESKEDFDNAKKIVEKEKSFKSISTEETFEKSLIVKNIVDTNLKELFSNAKTGDVFSSGEGDLLTLYLVTEIEENEYFPLEDVKDIIKEKLVGIYIENKIESVFK